MELLFCIPFGLQGVSMFFDEFYFHRKRGLGHWETLSHPIDTVAVGVCYAFMCTRPFSMDALRTFVLLGLVSCLLITKDEFVHQRECTGGECWLHSILFILHPIVLASAALLWHLSTEGGPQSAFFALVLRTQLVVVSLFATYQMTYWGLQWNRSPARQQPG